jgi:hypothetical protein
VCSTGRIQKHWGRDIDSVDRCVEDSKAFSPADFLSSFSRSSISDDYPSGVYFKATTDHDLQAYSLQMQILRLSLPQVALSAASSMILKTQDG